DGRVIDPDTQEPLTGLYTAGWIKRGASGVIGTNKPDAAETIEAMLDDLEAGRTLEPDDPSPEGAEALVAARKPTYFSYADWQRLDEIEVKRGEEQGRPRGKFTDVHEMLEALEKEAAYRLAHGKSDDIQRWRRRPPSGLWGLGRHPAFWPPREGADGKRARHDEQPHGAAGCHSGPRRADPALP